MAEIKVTDLPTITLDDFTANDRFLVIDDGKARQLTRGVFQQWLVSTVRGERGYQGPTGKDGINGINGADGQKGADGLSAYQLAVSQGYSKSLTAWLDSLKGSQGDKGEAGGDGWSPLLRVVPRGAESVIQIYNWVGGTGDKPETLGYIGESGIVTNIVNAVNIRGYQGNKGDAGAKGDTGANGVDGKDGTTVTEITYGEDNSLTLKLSDGSSVASNSPVRETGYGVYADGQFLESNPLVISQNSQEVLPNNSTTIVEELPYGVETFYSLIGQKYILESTNSLYSVRVRFKVSPDSQQSIANLSFSKGTTDLPYNHDFLLRGDSKPQDVDLTTIVHGHEAIVANGLSIRVKTFDRSISIYNIEVTIAKVL